MVENNYLASISVVEKTIAEDADGTKEESEVNKVAGEALELYTGDMAEILRKCFIRGPGAPAFVENLVGLYDEIKQASLEGYLARCRHSVRISMVRVSLLYRTPYRVIEQPLIKMYSAELSVSAAKSDFQRPFNRLKAFNPRRVAGHIYGSNSFARIEAAVKLIDRGLTVVQYYQLLFSEVDLENHNSSDEKIYLNGLDKLISEGLSTSGQLIGLAQFICMTPSTLGQIKALAKGNLDLQNALMKELLEAKSTTSILAAAGIDGAPIPKGLLARVGAAHSFVTDATKYSIKGLSIADSLSAAGTIVQGVSGAYGMGRAIATRDEGAFIQASLSTLAAGLTWRAFAIQAGKATAKRAVATALPVGGWVYFAVGTAIDIGLILFDVWWNTGGKSTWYSDTYTIFEDNWGLVTADEVYREFSEEAFGQPKEVRDVVQYIDDKYKDTIFERLTRDSNLDVEWSNWNWLSMLERVASCRDEADYAQISSEEYARYFDVTDEEYEFFAPKILLAAAEPYAMGSGGNTPAVYAPRPPIGEAMVQFFRQIVEFCEDKPQSAFAELFSNALKLGTFPNSLPIDIVVRTMTDIPRCLQGRLNNVAAFDDLGVSNDDFYAKTEEEEFNSMLGTRTVDLPEEMNQIVVNERFYVFLRLWKKRSDEQQQAMQEGIEKIESIRLQALENEKARQDRLDRLLDWSPSYL